MERYIKGDLKYGPWHRMPGMVKDSIFKLIAGNAQGTTFVISTSKNYQKGIFETSFITADHLLEDIDNTNPPLLFDFEGDNIYEDINTYYTANDINELAFDTALLVMESYKPIIPEQKLLSIYKTEELLEKGCEIGWLGYHGFNEARLKLFRGDIASYDQEKNRYLLNAAPKPGISGAPAFTKDGRLVGVVTIAGNSFDKYVHEEQGQLSLVPLEELKASLEDDKNTVIL